MFHTITHVVHDIPASHLCQSPNNTNYSTIDSKMIIHHCTLWPCLAFWQWSVVYCQSYVSTFSCVLPKPVLFFIQSFYLAATFMYHHIELKANWGSVGLSAAFTKILLASTTARIYLQYRDMYNVAHFHWWNSTTQHSTSFFQHKPKAWHAMQSDG